MMGYLRVSVKALQMVNLMEYPKVAMMAAQTAS